MTTKDIYCCGCRADVYAELTDGSEIYPHRPDLSALPFWICRGCGNFVGCHHKTKDRTRPLGCIPTPELRRARQRAHALIDSIWQSGRMSRSTIYAAISAELGAKYHTGETRTIADVNTACDVVRRLQCQRVEVGK